LLFQQAYTSSDDEDELSHLKPKDPNGVLIQATSQPQATTNTAATPSAGKAKQVRISSMSYNSIFLHLDFYI